MAKIISQVKIDGVEYAIAPSAYAECSTAAGTAAKVASTCTDGDTTNNEFSLIKGVSISVKFTYANSVANPTLNINSTGAKSIFHNGAKITSDQYWAAGAIVNFVYDGTNWVVIHAIKGPVGATGPAYTLTTTDKSSIVDAVLAALPKWTGGVY